MKNPLTDSELSVFAKQLTMVLHSGISALEGISIMKEDMPEGEGRQIIEEVYQSFEETGNLAESLQKSGVFTEYFIKMTEIGERSGTLETVMSSLADYYGRQDVLMRNIKDAIVYPLVMLGMLFAILIVLMVQVMPVFRDVFSQLGIEMTGISSMVFRVSNFLQRISIGLLVVIVAAALVCVLSLRSKKGRDSILSLLIRLPIGKKVANLLACSRFCEALSLALHSGLYMGEGFELAAGLSDMGDFKAKTANANALMEEGEDLADALRKSGIITGLNAHMVSIGFRTGSAESALKDISIDCQEEVDRRIQGAISALEPVLTAVLSILTGLILVSVMLPLLGVMSNIG